MGGCSSKSAPVSYTVATPQQQYQPRQDQSHAPVTRVINQSKGKGKGGRGKGKGKGKGRGRGLQEAMKSKWQTQLRGTWTDYGKEEDTILKQTFLVGQPNARTHIRGQTYHYSFDSMTQSNTGTGNTRRMRPPVGLTAPKQPLVPPGAVVICHVPKGTGKSFDIPDPNNPGRLITVAVPPGVQHGAKLAVPVPAKGEAVEEVVIRQKKHDLSTGSKVAIGAALLGPLVVGGVILGDHYADGAIGDWTATAVEDAADWTGDAVVDAGEWIGDGGLEDAAEWTGEAAGDAWDWTGEALADAVDWTGDAFEDVGDFLADVF